jgi:hypothetical protein
VWLPHLADVGVMTDVLSRHAAALRLPGAVTQVELLDARLTHPHRPESPVCRGWATYLVRTTEPSAVQLYVKGFPDDGLSEAAWQLDRRATHLQEEDLVVWRFPDDPRLPALPALVDPRLAAAVLPDEVRDVLGADPALRTTMVRYQPEASATLRLEADRDGAPAVYAKHLADGTVADVAARHQALWSRAERVGAPLLAEPLAADAERGVLWTRGVPGLPLTSAVPPARLPETTASVGALLAALHASPVDVAERVTVDDLLAEARKKADKLARAHPPVAALVSGLVSTAELRRADVVQERDRTLHGDFHLDQLVGSPQGPVLVDLDSIVRGAPEIDLAEFLVDLALRGLPDGTARDVTGRLLTSYADSSGTDVDPDLLAIFADVEFLNRCYRKLRHHAPGWQADLETELARHAAVTDLVGA